MKDFVGIVLGGDMNSYAIARAFFEEYRIKTILLGRYPLYPTTHSKLIEAYYYNNLLCDDVLLLALKRIEEKYPNKKKILFGNTDYYVKHIIRNRNLIEKISHNFIIPMTSEEQFDQLFDKASFYKLCDKYELMYPKSIVFDFKVDDINSFKIDLNFPIFIKPSNTIIYQKYNFKDKKKGYKINNFKELREVINKIKKLHYNDKFIFQEYIHGTDSFVYTAYATKNKKVAVISAGKILMEDRSPELIGNYNAITGAYNKRISLRLKMFLEAIGFTGICHFDIRYCPEKNKYYVFECNVRQGRSNYYNLANKVNLVKYIIDDYIYNKNFKFKIAHEDFTVSLVPKYMLKSNLKMSGQIKNFHRFTLAKYDINFYRLYYQIKYDRKIMKQYYEFLEEDVCVE